MVEELTCDWYSCRRWRWSRSGDRWDGSGFDGAGVEKGGGEDGRAGGGCTAAR